MAELYYDTAEFGPAVDSTGVPEYVLDPWSFYDFKPQFRLPSGRWTGALVPSWVPPHHRRRLHAYIMLEAFYRTCARRYLEANWDERAARREYGDPFLIVEAVKSSVVGNSVKFVVPAAAAEDATPDDKKAQDTLNEWFDDEAFETKISESERNAVKLGDGVMVLGWDKKRKRPRLRVYDPGFYFPCFDALSDEEFPDKVHIAYEYEDEDDKGRIQKWVRRITWELREAEDNATPLPWTDGESPDQTCYFKDQKWLMGQVGGMVEDFNEDSAYSLQDEIDLGIDFIPVIHTPNMAPDCGWGTSTIANVIQLFDDIVATDTDLQSASALTGTPVIGLGNAVLPKDSDGKVTRYGPGDMFETGEGKLDMLDTSHSLDALLKNKESLQDRLSVNSRTPGTLTGRIDPAKVQSGVIMTISFAPHTTMIREMRGIRNRTGSLLLKFVLRFFMKEGMLKTCPKAIVQYGGYLPADKTEAGTVVQLLLTAKGISRETAIHILLEAGYPIADINTELEKIASTDFAGADQLLTATNDTEAAREYLGLGPAPAGTTEAEQIALQAQQASDALAAKNAGGGGNNPPAK